MLAQASRTGAHVRVWRWQRADEFRDWQRRGPIESLRAILDYTITVPAGPHSAEVAARIEITRPDRVIASGFGYGAMIAAEAAGIPCDLLMPNIYALPVPGRPPFGTGLRPGRGPVGRLRDRWGRLALERLYDRYAGPAITRVRAEHGLPPLEHVLDQVRGVRRQLVLSAAAFDFPAELPRTCAWWVPCSTTPPGRRMPGSRRAATSRSCSWGSRRRSRARPTASSASSSRSPGCPSAPS